jgi:CheY-like chemotaxis protein
LEKPFVLLADDNEATCTLITAVLHNDFVVEVASDGNEAVEKLKSRHYAAILLDILMPFADGYTVLDFLKENRPDLLPHVLVVTASLGARELQRVRSYDVFGIMPKPFDVDGLLLAVRRAAGVADGPSPRYPILSSGMILLLGELLRRV